jgi:hypothetical protein
MMFFWMKNFFVKEVKRVGDALPPDTVRRYEALLTLDNSSFHNKLDALMRAESVEGRWTQVVDGVPVCVNLYFLPPNTTSLIQPMDQNLFQQVKGGAKKDVQMYSVEEAARNPGMKGRIEKALGVEEAVVAVNDRWMDLGQQNIQKAWGPLLWFHWNQWNAATKEHFGCPDAPYVRTDRMCEGDSWESRIVGKKLLHVKSDANARSHMLAVLNGLDIDTLPSDRVTAEPYGAFFALLAQHGVFDPIPTPQGITELINRLFPQNGN